MILLVLLVSSLFIVKPLIRMQNEGGRSLYDRCYLEERDLKGYSGSITKRHVNVPAAPDSEKTASRGGTMQYPCTLSDSPSLRCGHPELMMKYDPAVYCPSKQVPDSPSRTPVCLLQTPATVFCFLSVACSGSKQATVAR